MRRLLYLVLLAVFLGTSLSGLSASTDCQRWFAAYRQELVHTRQLQRVAAAKRRARAYLRRKLAGFGKPAPKPHLLMAAHPHMTRRQTLRHLDIACGVLPEVDENTASMASEPPPDSPLDPTTEDYAALLPAGVGDLLAENEPPSAPFTGQSTALASGGGAGYSSLGGPGGARGPGGFGGGGYGSGAGTAVPPQTAPVNRPPATPGGTQPAPDSPPGASSNPPSGTQPAPPSSTPPALTPPPAVVPEPATYVLLATGLAGLAGTIRRRLQA